MSRRVRTPEGAEFYGQPIGSVIKRDIPKAFLTPAVDLPARVAMKKNGLPGAWDADAVDVDDKHVIYRLKSTTSDDEHFFLEKRVKAPKRPDGTQGDPLRSSKPISRDFALDLHDSFENLNSFEDKNPENFGDNSVRDIMELLDADFGAEYSPGEKAWIKEATKRAEERGMSLDEWIYGEQALQAAGVRRVRTPAGAEYYGQPIGSVIVPNTYLITGRPRAGMLEAGDFFENPDALQGPTDSRAKLQVVNVRNTKSDGTRVLARTENGDEYDLSYKETDTVKRFKRAPKGAKATLDVDLTKNAPAWNDDETVGAPDDEPAPFAEVFGKRYASVQEMKDRLAAIDRDVTKHGASDDRTTEGNALRDELKKHEPAEPKKLSSTMASARVAAARKDAADAKAAMDKLPSGADRKAAWKTWLEKVEARDKIIEELEDQGLGNQIPDDGPTIRVANKAQKILLEKELKGQISDGMWENSGPKDHWEVWSDADVIVDPDNPGRNFFARKDNYNLNSSTLLDIVGERMVESVQEAGDPSYDSKKMKADLAQLKKLFKQNRPDYTEADAAKLAKPAPAAKMSDADMIEEAEKNPVKSMKHVWGDGQQEEYDALPWRGRSLYDNLRTKFGMSHDDAGRLALEKYGEKKKPEAAAPSAQKTSDGEDVSTLPAGTLSDYAEDVDRPTRDRMLAADELVRRGIYTDSDRRLALRAKKQKGAVGEILGSEPAAPKLSGGPEEEPSIARSAKTSTTKATSPAFIKGKGTSLGEVTDAKGSDPERFIPKESFPDGTVPQKGARVRDASGNVGTVSETYQLYTAVNWDDGSKKVVRNSRLNSLEGAKAKQTAKSKRAPATSKPGEQPRSTGSPKLKNDILESMSNDADDVLRKLLASEPGIDGDTDRAMAREIDSRTADLQERRKQLVEYRRRLNAGEMSELEYKEAVADMFRTMLGEDGPEDGDPVSEVYEKFESWTPDGGGTPGGIRSTKSARELADEGVAGKELRDALRRENPGFSNAQAHVVANKMAAEAAGRSLEVARKNPQNPESRKVLAEAGEAMPDGSFPTPNKLYFQKAVRAVGRTSPDKREMVREYLKKRADALGLSVPDSWNENAKDNEPGENTTAKLMAAAGVTGKQLRDQLRKENPHFTNAQVHLVSRKMEAQAAADKESARADSDGLSPDDMLMLQMQLTPGFPDQESITKKALEETSVSQLNQLLQQIQSRIENAGAQQKPGWQNVLGLVADEARKRLGKA